MLKAHPKGLSHLFFTETWERFGFYGMRALLTLYMIRHVADGGLGWSNEFSMKIYGWFIGLAFLTTIVGGYIADHYIGQKKSIYLGGVFLALGYFSIAIPTSFGFFLGLGLICIGNGFFKPCVTSILGQLYKKGDTRRDGGYALFYMGINLGAVFSPLVCGALQSWKGFSYGFATAGVGMLLSLVIFYMGERKYFQAIGGVPKRVEKKKEKSIQLSGSERNHIKVIVILGLFLIFFLISLEQAGALIAIYIEQYTNRNLFNYEVHSAYFQSLNPLFVLLLGPVFSNLWTTLGNKKIHMPVSLKLCAGFIFTALAYVCMIGATMEYRAAGASNMFWLVLYNCLLTAGEILIIPIIWSNVSLLAPKRFLSFLMAVTLTFMGFGNYLAGYVASFVDKLGPYQIFGGIAGCMGVVCVLLILATPKIESWIGDLKPAKS